MRGKRHCEVSEHQAPLRTYYKALHMLLPFVRPPAPPFSLTATLSLSRRRRRQRDNTVSRPGSSARYAAGPDQPHGWKRADSEPLPAWRRRFGLIAVGTDGDKGHPRAEAGWGQRQYFC